MGPGLKDLAYDVLLPLPVNGRQGGRDACDTLGRSVLQALCPYRKDDSLEMLPPQQCFTLLRCTLQGAMRRPSKDILVCCSLVLRLHMRHPLQR